MGISGYLSNLLAEGQRAGYFNLLPLNALHKSCCAAVQTEVVDFDVVKDKLTQAQRLHTLKSCDALKILPAQERLDFIEMKALREVLRRSRNQHNSAKLDTELREKAEDFNFLGKIVDSLHLLQSLTTLREMTFNDQARQGYLNARKHFVVLTDLDPEETAIEFFALNLAFLASFSTPIALQIERHLSTELSKVPSNLAPNFQPPMLMHCGQVDGYYAVLEQP
jgi:hypothetical protein